MLPELIYKAVMGDNDKSFAEGMVHNISYSLLINPDSYDITEVYQTGQDQFPLGEFILAICYSFLLFQLLVMAMQNKLFHHLPGFRDGVNWTVIYWVLLFALFKEWSDTGFPPVFTSPVLHDLSRMTESGLAITSPSSLSNYGCITSGPMDLCASSLPR